MGCEAQAPGWGELEESVMITHIAVWITQAVSIREMAVRLLLVLSFFLFSLAQAVAEEPTKAIADCNQFEDSARQIKGCTEFIRLGKALGPNLAVAYTNRGIAYAAQGNFKRAIRDFTEAIKLAPDDPHPYYNRGNAYYDLKKSRRRWRTTPLLSSGALRWLSPTTIAG
jgi:Tetratricopeptide repeat.